MHYIDIARWYADSEYKTWNAQGMRMWDYKDPWWVQCHGTFENGIAFDVTQGFVYGQLSRNQTHNADTVSYTHLDVYKRQLLTCIRGNIIIWGTIR